MCVLTAYGGVAHPAPGNPGGGDWGLQSPQYDEAGAVYLAGTENVLFDSCTFKYLDGNAYVILYSNTASSILTSSLITCGGA